MSLIFSALVDANLIFSYRTAASTILSIVYGTEPLKSREDPIVLRINHFMERMLKAALPGNYMVDMFPILNKLPPWLAKFKRDGMAAHEDFTAMFSEFLQGVKAEKVSPCDCYHITVIDPEAHSLTLPILHSARP